MDKLIPKFRRMKFSKIENLKIFKKLIFWKNIFFRVLVSENLYFSYFFEILAPCGLFHDVGEVEYYLYTNSQVASSKPRWFSTCFPPSIYKIKLLLGTSLKKGYPSDLISGTGLGIGMGIGMEIWLEMELKMGIEKRIWVEMLMR